MLFRCGRQCRTNSECLKKAIRAKALERAFDTRIPQEILDELVRTMEEQHDE